MDISLIAGIMMNTERKVKQGWTFTWKCGVLNATHDQLGEAELETEEQIRKWLIQ